ncbi:hypothetical protein ACFV4H_24900 [Streptomyces cellulosae]|nr:hypothetical protein OH709_01095 [Streptomyces cellulosae]
MPVIDRLRELGRAGDTSSRPAGATSAPVGDPASGSGRQVEDADRLADPPVGSGGGDRNRIPRHGGIWHLPLEASRDDMQTVLGFIAPTPAT